MAVYNEKDLVQMQKQLEAESARLQEERRQIQEQRIQVIRESEILAESKRQIQEESKKIQQRHARDQSDNTGIGIRGSVIDVEKYSMNDDFELWYEQFHEFINVNRISAEYAVSLFIMKIGTEGYRLLRNLCVPELPKNKSLIELVSLLQNHLKPKPSALTQRYKFKECRQQQGDTVNMYLAKLKQISLYCEFGSNLHNSLRDQLVWGLCNERMKKRLLAESNLTLDKAVEICAAMEAAEKDVADMGSEIQIGNRGSSLNYVKKKIQIPHKIIYKGPKEQNACFCCGKLNHKRNMCRFKEYTCNTCGKKGHLAVVCRKNKNINETRVKPNSFKKDSKPKSEQQKFIEDEEFLDSCKTLFHIHAEHKIESSKPLVVNLKVEHKPMLFEIDSGSPISAISWGKLKENKELSCLKMYSTDRTFTTYSGTSIVPKGVIKVNVCYGVKHFLFELFVLPGNSIPIIGREWLAKLDILRVNKDSCKNTINNLLDIQEKSIQNIIAKFHTVFSDKIGKCTTQKFKLLLKDDAKPICCKPRPVPFAMRERIEKEITRLIDEKILEQVESSVWATPVVPVLKRNGQVRLCGDYKITINPHLKINRYPIPRVTDLLSKLEKGQIFSKIDLAHAYQQIELEEASKELTTIATHKGLYKFNRLSFGMASAPGLFQNFMETILKGLPGVIVYFDDILIYGETLASHNDNLERTLERLEANGLTISLNKCSFAQKTVQFLGFELNEHGIKVALEKSKAIVQISKPVTVTQLKSFLGMVNYYSKFIPKYASIATPLYALLKKNVPFKWTTKSDRAFIQIKNLITSHKVLVHYSSEVPLKLTCDASPVGLGAVLSHVYSKGEEKPIAFASRTLTSAERRYSQLDKEALALIFAVKHFHQYIYGREFELETDHKPLIYIFGSKKGIPQMAASRVQRWAVVLAAYNFKIKHIKGSDNVVADSLSRIVTDIKDIEDTVAKEDYSFLNYVTEEVQNIDSYEVCEETEKDVTLKAVRDFVNNGWPNSVPDNVQCYKKRAFELSVEEGCVMWGHRVIIPKSLRAKILEDLHDTHWGTVKMKMIARSYFWWPMMNSDIERITKSCPLCLKNADNPPRAILHPWKWPAGPNQRVHADFCGPVAGHMYLIIIDSYSKWIDIKEMTDITAESTMRSFREYFATWGIPLTLVTDNGTNFTSDRFATFLNNNGVKHVRIAPYHPASNGEAENAVRTFKVKFKLLLSKMSRTEALVKYLFANRSTAHITTGVSPAELQINRKMRTRFDLLKPSIRERVELSQERQSSYFKGNRSVSFSPEEPIVAKDYSNNTWRYAKIEKQNSPVTYTVRTNDNRIWKRHVDQLRPRDDSTNSEPRVNDINTATYKRPTKSKGVPQECNKSVDIVMEKSSPVNSNNDIMSTRDTVPPCNDQRETCIKTDCIPRRSIRIRKPKKIFDL